MRRGRWWLIAGLLLAAVFAGRAYWEDTSLPTVPRSSQAAAQGHAPASQPIETIRVGQRVVASMVGKSNAEAAADAQVDPSSWRLLRLRAEDRWADGTLDVVRIETLQGPEWIAAHRATVGAKVPLPLDLQEMGLPGSLRAVVTANEPCPPVASGPGRVVLTTVNHLNANVLELTLADGRGRQERLRPTGSHKFFSEDRQEFVAAEELRQREHLRGASGRLTLLRAERATGVHRVYNMTVEGEHVYRVSLLGALVHNNCPPMPGAGGAPPTPNPGMGNIGNHGPVSPDVALSSAESWLGPGYREIAPGVYRSADRLRQFRMTTGDLVPTHGNIGPHVHFEIPSPSGGPAIENLHLPVIP
ncbi:MAG: polymorphic toxin-type HINT domain-containing protein [Thermoguttaceae bacterium]